ncbi:hypothetical protein MHYP_G00014240 [Metynnis hypsauchen]
MVHVTRMSLLIVLFMVSSAFGGKFIHPKKSSGPKCPASWVRYQGHCFFYISQALDWASAEARCLTLGAHLVSVHSESEYKMVKALIRTHDNKENPTWLGLSNCQKRGSWFWSDGSKFGYSKWNRNEPNALNGECCVHLNWADQKDWNDIPCNLEYPSVCRKKVARN